MSSQRNLRLLFIPAEKWAVGSIGVLLCMTLSGAFPQAAPAQAALAPVASNTLPSIGLLTLAQAKEIAFEKNWDLLAAKSGIDAATGQLIVAKEFPNPIASINTYKVGTYEAATTQGNSIWHRSYDTIAAVSQLIEIGGKRHDRQVAGRAGVLGARARFYDAKRTLDQGVTKAYVAALLAVENARVLGESAAYMRREADVAEARFKAGDLDESDLEQILIGVEQYELQQKAAEAAAAQARIAVEILMGLNKPQGNWKAADTLDEMNSNALAAPAARAGAERPDVLAAEADLRGGKAQLQLQRAIRIPDPTISLGVEHDPPSGGPPVDTFNIGISFPLPLWNLNGGNIKTAQAAVDQFALALHKARAQAAADVADAEVEYKEAIGRLKRYREQIKPQSAKSRESVAYAFEKGGATLVDLLEAERTDNDVRIATAQATSDTASAVADMAAAYTALTELDLHSLK
jgi:cobalt-zinc-cadmium efflux system outer membrane protein